VWPREREPESQYKGMPLSHWVYLSGGSYNPEAREAIKRFGTNALPYLLRWIQYEKPGWRKRLSRAVAALPSFIRYRETTQWLIDDSAETRAQSAAFAIGILGSDTETALPDLNRLAANSIVADVSERASFALAIIRFHLADGRFQEENTH
jgi:hypothetical protein